MKKILLLLSFAASSLVAAEVVCATIHENIKKIRCKYMHIAEDTARKVTFQWISPDNPADNRSKIQNIPAGHISVYDDRYFSGRSEGRWKVEVIEADETKVSTVYLKDRNSQIMRIQPDDPILKKIR